MASSLFFKAFDMKMNCFFWCKKNKKKGFALSLVLKVRIFRTGKWPITSSYLVPRLRGIRQKKWIFIPGSQCDVARYEFQSFENGLLVWAFTFGFRLDQLPYSISLIRIQRPLCVVWRLGRAKNGSAWGAMGRGNFPPFPSSHRPPCAFYF